MDEAGIEEELARARHILRRERLALLYALVTVVGVAAFFLWEPTWPTGARSPACAAARAALPNLDHARRTEHWLVVPLHPGGHPQFPTADALVIGRAGSVVEDDVWVARGTELEHVAPRCEGVDAR